MKNKLIGLLSIVACTAALASCESKEKADKVIYGNIYTSNDENKKAEAIAIKDDLIIYVGSKKGARKYINRDTDVQTFDNEKLITPGLVDGHIHVAALKIGEANKLGQIRNQATVAQCIEDIGTYVNNNPTSTFYVLSGWEMSNFSEEPNGCPSASMIDYITTKPILAISSDGHSYWCNTPLMNMAGINDDTVSPDGGVIIRDISGKAVGTFNDTAEYLIDEVRPEKPTEVYEKGFAASDEFCLEQGYTSRFQAYDNEAFNSWKYPRIVQMEKCDRENKLKTYCQSSFVINNTDDAFELVDAAINLRESTRGGNFEVTNVKIFLDGIIENAGAYLSEPYSFNDSYYGTQRWKTPNYKIKMGHIIAKANAEGMPVHFHCMGDQATSDALDAIEYAAGEIGIERVQDCRNAITHLALVKDSDFQRFKDLNVVAVFNPWADKDPTYYDVQCSILGKERADKQYPMQSFLKAGVNYAFGTDYGASFTYNSIECYHNLVTRMYNTDKEETLLAPEERLSREEALKAMTIGGAYELHRDFVSGSLEKGKYADLCVFSKDLLEISEKDIMSTKVENSMFRGNWSK